MHIAWNAKCQGVLVLTLWLIKLSDSVLDPSVLALMSMKETVPLPSRVQ